MSDGTIHRPSPAKAYAKDKSLTTRRSRSAAHIEGFLFREEPTFVALLELDEERVRRVATPWVLAPSAEHQGYRPPLMIGQHALLAFPGTIIESLDEEPAMRQTARLLIKAAEEGVIFNLLGRIELAGMDWSFKSMEAATENIRDECLRRLLARTKELVRVDIPALLALIEQR